MHIQEAANSFPGFGKALDSDFMVQFISESFKKRRKDVLIEHLENVDVKFEPGRQCVILYRVKLYDRFFRKRWEQFFLGKVLMKDELPPTLPKEAFYSQETGIILSPFPHDPVMDWLPSVYEKGYMKKRISAIIDTRRYQIQNLSVTLLGYTPMMRATFLYKIKVHDKENNQTENWEWVGKTNHYKPSARVFINYWALWKGAQHKVPMPKPMGFLQVPPMTFQEKIAGIRLGALTGDPNISLILKHTADLIAAFHNLKVPINNVRGLDQEIKNLNRWSDVVINLRPDLKMRMEVLRKDIVDTMGNWFSADHIIHADFHHTNLLVDGTFVQLIDMDEVTIGDPCVDIGRFLSSLRIPSLRTFGSFDGLKNERELFLEEYLKQSQQEVRKVRLFEAASLFTSAASAFRLQRQNWEIEVALLLEEAEKAFLEVKKGKPFALGAKKANYSLTKEEKLAFARDEIYMKALFSPHVYRKTKGEIVSCKMISEKYSKGYYRISYKISTVGKRIKVKDKVEIFIKQSHEGRSRFRYVNFLSSKLENTEAALFFPQALGAITELGAFAFYRASGKSILALIGTEEGLAAAGSLARCLALFHKIEVEPEDCNLATVIGLRASKKQIVPSDGTFQSLGQDLKNKIQLEKRKIPLKISYALSTIAPSKLKYGEDGMHILFPIRKYVSHPFTDIGNFLAKMRVLGKKRRDIPKFQTFTQTFKEEYCERFGKMLCTDLFLFEAEAIVGEALKMKSDARSSGLKEELLREAEGLMESQLFTS